MRNLLEQDLKRLVLCFLFLGMFFWGNGSAYATMIDYSELEFITAGGTSIGSSLSRSNFLDGGAITYSPSCPFSLSKQNPQLSINNNLESLRSNVSTSGVIDSTHTITLESFGQVSLAGSPSLNAYVSASTSFLGRFSGTGGAFTLPVNLLYSTLSTPASAPQIAGGVSILLDNLTNGHNQTLPLSQT
jgi:hypothetical protein